MEDSTQRGGEAAYHHGDLRRALLDAAKGILSETGRWDFSLREVARRAGVSHNAPYRHFADKEALLAELGAAGYVGLREAGAAAVLRLEGGDARDVLVVLGNSYVAFGTANPALYRLMFGQALPGVEGLPTKLLAAVEAARDALRDVILAGAGDGSFAIDPRDPVAVRAATVGAWSIVHGLVLLTIDRIVTPDDQDDPRGFGAEEVIDLFVDGLSEVIGSTDFGTTLQEDEAR